jgi:tetratricopeptide (TPR) repeat protein
MEPYSCLPCNICCCFTPLQIVEVAMQQLMLDQPTAAAEGFEAALKLDELNMRAALGLAEAHLAAGQLEEAEQQLQFLPELLAASKAAGGLGADAMEVHGHGRQVFGFAGSALKLGVAGYGQDAVSRRASRVTTDSTGGLQLVAGASKEDASEPLLLYLRGLLAWKQGKQQEGLQLLQQYMDLQLTVVEDLPYGLGMLEALHASRVLGLLRLLLSSVGGDPRQSSDPPSPLLANCIRYMHNIKIRCMQYNKPLSTTPAGDRLRVAASMAARSYRVCCSREHAVPSTHQISH